MRSIKRALTIGVAICMAVSLAGCKKEEGPTKEELIQDNAAYSALIDEQTAKIAELESTLKEVTGTDEVTLAISKVSDGSDKLGFNSILGKLLFPVNFEYPNSTQAPIITRIQLDSGIWISPSGNWITHIDGNTSEYSHSSGINGVIKIAAISEKQPVADIETNIVEPFIAALPHTSATTSKIFYSDVEFGSLRTLETTVDGEDGVLKVAYIARGERAITMCFFYPGALDATKDEIITVLLETITLGDTPIKIK